jgi:hypothetical protein
MVDTNCLLPKVPTVDVLIKMQSTPQLVEKEDLFLVLLDSLEEEYYDSESDELIKQYDNVRKNFTRAYKQGNLYAIKLGIWDSDWLPFKDYLSQNNIVLKYSSVCNSIYLNCFLINDSASNITKWIHQDSKKMGIEVDIPAPNKSEQ